MKRSIRLSIVLVAISSLLSCWWFSFGGDSPYDRNWDLTCNELWFNDLDVFLCANVHCFDEERERFYLMGPTSSDTTPIGAAGDRPVVFEIDTEGRVLHTLYPVVAAREAGFECESEWPGFLAIDNGRLYVGCTNGDVLYPRSELFCFNLETKDFIYRTTLVPPGAGEDYTQTPFDIWGDYLVYQNDYSMKVNGVEQYPGIQLNFIRRDSLDGEIELVRSFETANNYSDAMNTPGFIHNKYAYILTRGSLLTVVDLEKAIDPANSEEDCVVFRDTWKPEEITERQLFWTKNIIFEDGVCYYQGWGAVTARSIASIEAGTELENEPLWRFRAFEGRFRSKGTMISTPQGILDVDPDGPVWLIDKETGIQKWECLATVLENDNPVNNWARPVVIDDKYALFQDYTDFAFVVLDLSNGKRALKYRVEQGVSNSAISSWYHEGVLYCVTDCSFSAFEIKEK